MNKRALFLNVILGLLLGLLLVANFVSAQDVKIPNPLGETDTFCKLLLNGIIPAVNGLIGALGTIMIIVAGILFLTSAGSPERMITAKKALFFAIIGIAIAVSSETIVLTIKWALNAAGGKC